MRLGIQEVEKGVGDLTTWEGYSSGMFDSCFEKVEMANFR